MESPKQTEVVVLTGELVDSLSKEELVIFARNVSETFGVEALIRKVKSDSSSLHPISPESKGQESANYISEDDFRFFAKSQGYSAMTIKDSWHAFMNFCDGHIRDKAYYEQGLRREVPQGEFYNSNLYTLRRLEKEAEILDRSGVRIYKNESEPQQGNYYRWLQSYWMQLSPDDQFPIFRYNTEKGLELNTRAVVTIVNSGITLSGPKSTQLLQAVAAHSERYAD